MTSMFEGIAAKVAQRNNERLQKELETAAQLELERTQSELQLAERQSAYQSKVDEVNDFVTELVEDFAIALGTPCKVVPLPYGYRSSICSTAWVFNGHWPESRQYWERVGPNGLYHPPFMDMIISLEIETVPPPRGGFSFFFRGSANGEWVESGGESSVDNYKFTVELTTRGISKANLVAEMQKLEEFM